MNLPNVTVRQLEYLIAVADTGGLTSAATRCHVSQAAISLAISEVERVLGVRMFLRSPRRGAALTPAGRELVADARTVVAAMVELGANARGLGERVEGTLVVGCYAPIAPFHLPVAIATFQRRHPEVTVRFTEGTLRELQDHLLSGRCEIAFLYEQDVLPGIEWTRLYEQSPMVLVPGAHRLAGRDTIALAELVDEPFILLDVPPSERYFGSVFTSAGLPLRPAHRASSFELARSLVARGLGYSMTVQQPVIDRSYEGLEVLGIPLSDDVPRTPVLLGWAQGGPLTRRAQAFLGHCAALFADGRPSST